jgi:N-acetylglucosamine-6-phosphate deacetylase
MKLGVAAALVDGALVKGDVDLVDGRVARVGIASGGSGLAAPGFVDLQVNGFGGVDFAESGASGYRRAGEALLKTGVTAFQPTLITSTEEELIRALEAAPLEGIGPLVLGFHLEGPFLAPGQMGAHDPTRRHEPDLGFLRRVLRAGPVSQVTLAPELPGALEVIAFLRARGIVVSCGHTDATAEEATAAFAAGASTVTHLFNAMRPLRHRDPGIVGAALANPNVTLQIIADGHHLAPEILHLLWAGAAGRIALVTDAIAAAADGDGDYTIARKPVSVRDGVARTPDGTLAGSTLTMDAAVRHVVQLGVPLAEALGAASSVPARILGRGDIGCLRVGSRADVVILDDRLEVKDVHLSTAPPVAA